MLQPLADALAERGYDTLTPVQEAVTDPALQGADLVVSAQTGSGKTVGFGLAIAPTLFGEDATLGPAAAPLALIVAPTRELALQVMRELGWLYAKAGARVTTCIGGMDMRDERRALERGAHIVVGTPGRLRDHIQRGSLEMGDLRAIVLDEADEMLDLGFREDLEFMLGAAPQDRRTLMFSATVPPMIEKLAKQFQRDAVRVSTQSDRGQHADIAYQAIRVAPHDAENAIINLLRFHDAENALVFANTRAAVSRLTARLTNRGFSVVPLSGELSQAERTHALQAMRDGRARVCVATDVAARGIDLPGLELVIHAELPSNAETLLHRSGRTGRAGRKGISALIVPPKLSSKAGRLLSTARTQAEWTTPPTAEEILRRDEERLLSDPVWTTEPTAEQRAFAARLLELHGPERIAAAYLALHQSRLSAPEDIADPGARPERKERAPFGPSAWVALSVGRDDRAEPRWLLPLLCRAGNLDKDSIGAIRVQQSESHVEILEAALPAFLAAIGPGGELEKGVTARRLDAAPETAPRPAAPRVDAPSEPRPPAPPRAPKQPDRMARALAEGAVTPGRSAAPPPRDKPAKKPRWDKAAPGEGKPAGEFKGKTDGKPAGKFKGKSDGKPAGKFKGKPDGKAPGKFKGSAEGKAPGKFKGSAEGKPAGKFKGKAEGKGQDRRGPDAAPEARKEGRKPRPAASASDTSKRFTPPGSPKTRREPGPPRRSKPR